MRKGDSPAGSFAAEFKHLIQTVHPPGRDPYSDQEIGEAIGKSRQYVWQLRESKRGEPRQSTVLAITQFFGSSATVRPW